MILWNQIEHYIKKIAWKYVPMLKCKVSHQEDEDLLSEGYFAVRKAIAGYNPEGGRSFIGYLTFFLHSAFSDVVARDLGEGSRGKSYRMKMLRKFEENFLSLTGRLPSDEETCQGLGMTFDTLHALRAYWKTTSIDESITDDEDVSLLDRIPSDVSVEDDVIDEIVRRQVHDLLRDYINELPVNQKKIIELVYYRGFSDRKASVEMQIDYNKLLQEKQKALRTIGRSKHLREIGRFLPECYEALAFHGGLGTFIRTGSSSTEYTAIRNVLGK